MKTSVIKCASMILIVILICVGCGPTPQETQKPTISPTINLPPATSAPSATTAPTVAPTATPKADSTALSSAQKQQLAHATVRISLLVNKSGKLQVIGTGSGTIISADGLILTNCHVANPALIGDSKDQPDALGVELVDSEDEPPVPTYFASVVDADPTLDLAVIKIDRDLDGNAVKSSSLDLPFANIGDSDLVKFGDPIYIFGFPGIGGDTITYTSGSVSGFDRMDPIGNRAWIKTDATIAGGNSGGLASNTNGEIIGVPTRIGTTSGMEVTDCRVIADTNGDGVIDDKDTCVPTGGFINAIRPINWGKGLIKAAKNQEAYTSPYEVAKTQPTKTVSSAADAVFTLDSWASEIDANNCPAVAVDTFASGTKTIYVVFSFKGMTSGEKWSARWLYKNREVFSNDYTWDYKINSGSCFEFSLVNKDKALPDGAYQIEIYTGADSTLTGTAKTEIGGTGSGTEKANVKVGGTVVDANTGKGIADIYVIVFRPGIDPAEWLNSDSQSDADIYSYTQTDSKGKFILPDLFIKGKNYGTAVGNSKLGYRSVVGSLNIKTDSPETLNLTIQLNK